MYQYFNGSDDLKLGGQIPSYADLSEHAKENFLQYDVVVRDLGTLHDKDIRSVFERINSTGYSLSAIELHNSRFDGEFKSTAEQIAEDEFFAKHRVFTANEIRSMEDTRFVLGYVTTVMSTYFHRDSELETFLEMYNEDFPHAGKVRAETKRVLGFVDECGFQPSSRVWKHADVFTLLVETHRAVEKDGLQLNTKEVGQRLTDFYLRVNSSDQNSQVEQEAAAYQKAALQATNDRSNRQKRGDIVANLLRG